MAEEMKKPGPRKLIDMYRSMLRARYFEEEAARLFQSGVLPGFLHSYIGEEGVAVGVCSALRDDDYITSTHRGHGHVVAKGANLNRMMAELFAKRTGHCKGKGGSMHIADFSMGVVGTTGIVGSGMPVANGVALAMKMKGRDQVVAAFFGDGAANTGSFHESLNLAAVWDLPVIFVCENNLYSESTPQREHQRIRDVSCRAAAYDMPGVTVDGNDVLAVYAAAEEAVQRGRSGKGPTLLEGKTYRFLGHYVGDPAQYRSKEEVSEWRKRCPIGRLKATLAAEGVMKGEEAATIENEVMGEVQEAVQFAKESPSPRPEEALEDRYS